MGGGGLAGRRLSGTLQEWPVGSPFTASLQPGPARPPPGARTRAVTVQKRLVFMATPRLGLPPAHPHAAGPSRLTCRVPPHPPPSPSALHHSSRGLLRPPPRPPARPQVQCCLWPHLLTLQVSVQMMPLPPAPSWAARPPGQQLPLLCPCALQF